MDKKNYSKNNDVKENKTIDNLDLLEEIQINYTFQTIKN